MPFVGGRRLCRVLRGIVYALSTIAPLTASAVCGGGGVSNLTLPAVTFLHSYRASFGAPMRLAASATGNVYVTDPEQGQVIVRAASGRVISRQSGFGRPISVAVGVGGRVYVGDGQAGRVTAYDADWRPAFQLGQGAGEFQLPNDIAVDAVSGSIYVADSPAHVVKIYGADGIQIGSVGGFGSGDGQFNYPVAVALDVAAQQLLVVDQLNYRVQRFDLAGNFVGCFGARGNGAGKFNMPQGVLVDGQGRVYVADAIEGRLQVLDRGGDLIGYIGDFGDAAAQMRLPMSLAIDATHRLFVASSNNARLEIFGLDSFTDPESVAPAVVRVEPNQIDRVDPSNAIVAYIEVPGQPLDQVVADSISANGIPTTPAPPLAGDHDGNGVPDLRVEFARPALLATLPADGPGRIAVAGTVGGMQFESATAVQVTTCGPETICSLGGADPQCNEAVCLAPGGCVVRPKADGTGCEDGDACTVMDQCIAGACVGEALVCNDRNVCTDDSCDVVSGCVFANNTTPCDDASACTTADVCDAGVCSGTPLGCDDGNVCTDDACDPANGCVNLANSLPCDDGTACTMADVCSDGHCAGTALACDDGNVCTDDVCDRVRGCVAVNNSVACDDGSLCTISDVCEQGQCRGTAVSCDDSNLCTDDSCDPRAGCGHIANALSCTDGNACTIDDVCSGGSCHGAPLDCDDRNQCTDDSCVPASGCAHANNTAVCDDADPGTVGDICDANGRCSGRNVLGNYAVLRWPPTAKSNRPVTLSTHSTIRGDVCAERVVGGPVSRIDGTVVGLAASGRAITLRRQTHLSGDAVSGGGTVRLFSQVTIDGRIDQAGGAAAVGECFAARYRADSRRALLTALPPTSGFVLGVVELGSGVTRRIPEVGGLGAGQTVVEIADLRLGGASSLRLVGTPSTATVVVHIRGRLRLGAAARIEIEGLTAEQVTLVVDGSVILLPGASVSGSIFSPDTVRLGRNSMVSGAILGGSISMAPYSSVDLHPFAGW